MDEKVMRKYSWFHRLRHLLDPWSVPHFLFGMVTGLAAVTFIWPLLITLIATIIAALFWEYVERQVKIHEARGNPWADIVLSILAFGMTLLLVDQTPLHDEQHFSLFVSVLLLFLFTNLVAWRARLQKEREFLN